MMQEGNRKPLEADSRERVLEGLEGQPRKLVPAGEMVLEQGAGSRDLVFLVEGTLEVIRDGHVVERESCPGSVYGVISVLLGDPQIAGIRTASECRLVLIGEPLDFLRAHPDLTLHLCWSLAGRLASATRYLVDARRQFSGQAGHLSMLDRILTTLVHRNPRTVRPDRTAIRPDH